jgi:hypothetical protein
MHRATMEKLLNRKRQYGQAIYLALAAIVFLSLMTYATFNISQMTHAKSQTMNAADAGAYTVAVVVARDLNFKAYTNRAMVANHAVVGQLTSLASLSNMIYLASKDISYLKYLQSVPYVGPIFKTIADVFEEVMDVIESALWPALEWMTEAHDALIQLISVMQDGSHYVAGVDLAPAIKNVVEANDPQLQWALSSGGGAFVNAANLLYSLGNMFTGGFVKQQGTSDGSGCSSGGGGSDDSGWGWGLDGVDNGVTVGGSNSALSRMREVVNDSRDGMTVNRDWLDTPPTPGFIRNRYFFHGGTKLSCDNKTWVAVDGFELRFCRTPFDPFNNRCSWLRRWLTGEVAGSSGASDWRQLSRGELTYSGHGTAYNRRHYQYTYQLPWDGLKDKYSGLQPYYELVDTPKPGEGDLDRPTPTFVVAVFKPVQSNSTPNATQTFQTDAGNPFHLNEGRNQIHGVAAAHAYFRRPARSDDDPSAGRLPNQLYRDGTYATLFAPYWQARLTNLPPEIAAALAATD